jgi:hypothetical protein
MVGTQQFHEFCVIYQDILSSGLLDLIVAGAGPLRWMVNDTGTHHVQIDVGTATKKMFPIFDSRRVITILPEGPITILPPIEFLAGPTGDQLHGFWNDVTIAIVGHEQVNVAGGDHVIQDRQTVSFPCLI